MILKFAIMVACLYNYNKTPTCVLQALIYLVFISHSFLASILDVSNAHESQEDKVLYGDSPCTLSNRERGQNSICLSLPYRATPQNSAISEAPRQ